MAEAAFSPGLDTVAPSRALELSGSVNAASSSLVLLDVLGVSACVITSYEHCSCYMLKMCGIQCQNPGFAVFI